MAQVLSPGGVKPKPWRVRKDRVAEEWQWWWDRALQRPEATVIPAAWWGQPPHDLIDYRTGELGEFGSDVSEAGDGPFGAQADFQGGASAFDNYIRWDRTGIDNDPVTLASLFLINVPNDFSTFVGLNVEENDTNKGVHVGLENGPLAAVVPGAGGPIVTSITPSTGVWYFAAGTYDRSTLRLFVRNMETGALTSASTTDTFDPIDGDLWGFGQTKIDDAAVKHDGLMAGGWILGSALSENDLKRWSRDPFGPFRPARRTVVSVPAAGQTVTVGLATESDSALGVGASKTQPVSQPAETDAALALTALKTVNLGLATEAEIAQAASSSKTLAVGLPTETDQALALTAAKALSVGLVTESDVALALTVAKAAQVGLATETDTRLGLKALKEAVLGLASETDEALAVSTGTVVVVGLATEADSALAVGVAKALAAGLATETDTGLAVTPVRVVGVGLSQETEQALAVSVDRAFGVGLATETEIARAVSVAKAMSVGLATETGTALAVIVVGAEVDVQPPFTALWIAPARDAVWIVVGRDADWTDPDRDADWT